MKKPKYKLGELVEIKPDFGLHTDRYAVLSGSSRPLTYVVVEIKCEKTLKDPKWLISYTLRGINYPQIAHFEERALQGVNIHDS